MELLYRIIILFRYHYVATYFILARALLQ